MKRRIPLTTPQVMVSGFALLIIIGTLALSLPCATADNQGTGLLDSFFTATSATCVTGLTVHDTGSHFSTFGQIVILILMQIGGLGIMSFSTLAIMLAGGRLSYRFRVTLKESLNRLNVHSIVGITVAIFKLAVVVEFGGFIALLLKWGPEMGWRSASWNALFHSVSGFCNAGFSLFPDSLSSWHGDIVVNLIFIALIVIGGLGFTVIFDLIDYRATRRLSLHSRVVLTMSAFMIIGGAALIYFFEIYNPPHSFENYSFIEKAIAALFQSVTARTAGFNTVDIGSLSDASIFMVIMLMFVGASPGGTGGGIKTTTFFALLASGFAIVRGESDVRVFNRRLDTELLLRAFTIAMLSVTLIATVTLAMTAIEGRNLMHILFEVTSAFGTVGLSTGITPHLSGMEKFLITVTMFCGRLGPLTMAMALTQNRRKKHFRMPAGEIIIG